MRKLNGTGYLAGPMTGYPEFNYPEFHAVAKLFRDRGFTIHNPAEHFAGITTLPREVYLRAAIYAVLSCDYVIVLPGWQFSPGANLEVEVAVELKLPVYAYDPLNPGVLTQLDVERRAPRSTNLVEFGRWSD